MVRSENTTISMLTARNRSKPTRNTKNDNRLAASLCQENAAESVLICSALATTRLR